MGWEKRRLRNTFLDQLLNQIFNTTPLNLELLINDAEMSQDAVDALTGCLARRDQPIIIRLGVPRSPQHSQLTPHPDADSDNATPPAKH